MGIQMTVEQEKSLVICDAIVDFLMDAGEVFISPALGTVVTGAVEKGEPWTGRDIWVIHRDGSVKNLIIKEIIQDGKSVERPWWQGGKKISLRFEIWEKDAFRTGDIIAGWISCPVSPWEHDLWEDPGHGENVW